MNSKFTGRLIGSALTFGILALQFILPTGCANQIPPLGGARDSLPPSLVQVKPVDSSRSFNSKKIVFEFNEYVQLDNPSQNLLVSPTPKVQPRVDARLRTVTVTIADTLEPNTTYSLNFGNAIKDVNEGNVLKGFRYIFSTGETIDTLSLSGQVILAGSGKTDSTLIAALYRDGDDSSIIKKNPRYIARLDKNGRFRFQNLPNEKFYLYVFPGDGLPRYQRSKLFAFADKAYVTSETAVADTLYAYIDDEEKKPVTTTAARQPGGRNATQADKRLRIETNLDNGEQDLLEPFQVVFRLAPLKTFDSSKIQFLDENKQPIRNYTLTLDTSKTKLTLQYKWVEGSAYSLIVDKEFAVDTADRKLTKTDTLQFRAKKESMYGSVKWRFLNLDLSRHPVLQLVQGDEVKYSHVFVNREFNAKLFIPGDYDLRILYDDNQNGKWDPGSFFKDKHQPEKVKIIPRKVTVKAKWENEVDFSL